MLSLLSNVFVNHVLVTMVVLAITIFITLFLKKSIDIIFAGVKKKIVQERTLAKTRTIRALLKNIIDFILFFIAILVILSNWGFNIIPILTGAGILGLAISFGSQTLIKDLISGFLIIAEDQFDIGDRVKIDNYEGEVYRLTLRLTILKDAKGNLIYIPNSQINSVIRYKKVRQTIIP